ncbi:hypothetical protein D9M68_413020 [compost metagenome]
MRFRHTLRSVAAIAIANPDLSLRDIAPQLDQMGERPVRGGGFFRSLLALPSPKVPERLMQERRSSSGRTRLQQACDLSDGNQTKGDHSLMR